MSLYLLSWHSHERLYDEWCQAFVYWLRSCFCSTLVDWKDLKCTKPRPDRTQLQSTTDRTAADLVSSIMLIPLTAWRSGKELCLCVCTRLCSNCVDCMQPTERSVVWVMHCFSIGSDAQPPTWWECLQTSCSSLIFYYLEPAESSPKRSAVHLHSHPQHLHHIPNIYSENHGLQTNNLCEVWICNHIQKGQIQWLPTSQMVPFTLTIYWVTPLLGCSPILCFWYTVHKIWNLFSTSYYLLCYCYISVQHKLHKWPINVVISVSNRGWENHSMSLNGDTRIWLQNHSHIDRFYHVFYSMLMLFFFLFWKSANVSLGCHVVWNY